MTLSILQAVHNEAEHLAEAIQSVLDQSLTDFELVTVNDRSTDETLEIARSFAERDSRVRVFENAGAGKTDAFNHAYEMSTGSTFCLFAGDDVLPETSLATRSAALPAGNETAKLTVCGYTTMSDDDRFNNNTRLPGTGTALTLWSGAVIVFNKAFADQVFPIPANLPSEDLFAYFIALFGEAEITNIDQSLYRYRIHGGNSYHHSARHRDMRKRFDLEPEILTSVKERLFADEAAPDALQARLKCAEASIQGKTVTCLLSFGVPRRDRLRYAWRSNALLYDSVKMLMSQFGHK